jgi:AcrR family transcriptional regulator
MSERDPSQTADNRPADGAIRPLRADAQRNVERLIAAARDAFAIHGPEASLDDIARRAGVGSGTLYRHFPTRVSLMEAVYRESVRSFCADGDRLLATESAADALIDWLRGFVGYVAQKRGLAAALTGDQARSSGIFAEAHEMIAATGTALLERAKAAGAVRKDVSLMDLMRLVGAIAQAGETSSEGAALSDRLLLLAMEGVGPRRSRGN